MRPETKRSAQPVRDVMIGHQVILDLYDCDRDRLDSVAVVRAALARAARAAGATIVEMVFHKFSPWGVSGVVVIAESHFAIHTWPERRYAAIDLFTCGNSVDMRLAVRHLERAFQAGRAVAKEFSRGGEAT